MRERGNFSRMLYATNLKENEERKSLPGAVSLMYGLTSRYAGHNAR